MYAVVEIAGSQVKVREGDRIRVSRLKAEAGEKITLDRVLMVSQSGETRVGTPQVHGAAVEASVLGHGRDEKIIVFKMKRRKGYRRKNGHRQPFTELQIDGISVDAPAEEQEETENPVDAPAEEQEETENPVDAPSEAQEETENGA